MTHKIEIPKAIIFDWDNTLINSWPLIHNALNTTMGRMGKDLWSLDKVKKDVHKSMRESFPSLFGEKWQEAGDIYKKSYKSQHLSEIQLLPQAMELINFAHKKGVLLFVISNKIGNILRLEVDGLNITNKFFAIVGAGDANFDKPNKAPVDLALQNSNINPKNDLVWFIGDTITDIECAINSSCQPILYGEGINVPQNLIAQENKKNKILCFNNHREIIQELEGIFDRIGKKSL